MHAWKIVRHLHGRRESRRLQNVMVLYSGNATWNETQYTLAYLSCEEHFSGVLNVFLFVELASSSSQNPTNNKEKKKKKTYLDLDQKGHSFSAVK